MKVFAIDKQQYDSDALTEAKAYARLHEIAIHIELADATSLPFRDASFDCLICSSVIEYLDDPAQSVREMARELKSEGLVFIDFPLFQSPYGGHINDEIIVARFRRMYGLTHPGRKFILSFTSAVRCRSPQMMLHSFGAMWSDFTVQEGLMFLF